MPINIGNKVSTSDVEKVKNKKNAPAYREGFEPVEGEVDSSGNELFDFNDLDFNMPGDNNTSTGGFDTGATAGNTGTSGFGNTTGFGNPNDVLGGNQGAFGQPQTPPKKDAFDKVFDSGGEAAGALWRILTSASVSVRSKTADDWGTYFFKLMIGGAVLIGVSILLWIIGTAAGIHALRFSGIPVEALSAGVLCAVGIGLPGIVISAWANVHGKGKRKQAPAPVETTVSDFDFGDVDEEEEEDDYSYEPIEETDNSGYNFDAALTDVVEVEEVDYSKEVNNIRGNVPIITRDFLVDTFKSFFPCNTPAFADKRIIDRDSDEFASLETVCMKALAAASKIEFDDMEPALEKAIDTYFCYELWVKRLKGLNKLEDISREINAYAREDTDDTSVYSTVGVEGDFYKVILFKGNSAIVTMGDAFKKKEVIEFFKNPKNIYPMVVGIKPNGDMILRDAKLFETMMIVGKARSGKTWFIFNVLINLMAFNTPEDVQVVIIDPKQSSMLYTLSLLPHVAGYHRHDNILKILKDIIEVEGARREKILMDHKCDDIWELRKLKGIKLPVLYIFIDEIMTVTAALGGAEKELFELMKVIISQLPSKGIRLIFIPHRATGVVDATVRHLISFAAAIRANNDVVTETLGIKKFDQELPNPGDTAIMMAGETKAMYAKSIAVTLGDTENKELALALAKSFYKMGFDMPDTSTLGCAANRNEALVIKELQTGQETTRMQINNM